ncbi:hypothetical protein JCM10207_006212 [Rhodosporidiobolus poonsookiae]
MAGAERGDGEVAAPLDQTNQTSAARDHTDAQQASDDAGRFKKDAATTGTVKQDKQPERRSWRDKVGGMLQGPLDALFPRQLPALDLLYPPPAPSSAPATPAFLRGGFKRSAWRARKHLLRAMLVFLAAFILELNPDSLRVLGQASFFAMIVSVMLPPTFPAQVFLLVATMLVLGMCFGWAWGCAAMASALRARNQVLLASSVQRVSAGIAGATNPDVQYRAAIFRGEFLDARSTVVFGVFLWIGLFAMGLLRAKNVKLLLVAIFASIVMDVMCSYGPLFPIQQYTLATTFLLPTACYIAIAVASNVLIFPETLSYTWTTDLVDKFLSPVLQRSHLHSKLLSTPPPSFHPITDLSSTSTSSDSPTSPWQPFFALFASTQEATSTGLEGLLGSIPMLELEVSFGRLSSKDLAGLVDALRELHVRSVGLGVLFTTVQSRHKRYVALKAASTPGNASSSDEKPSAPSTRPYKETTRMRTAREKLSLAEHTNKHDLASLLPLLDSTTSDLRSAADAALEGAMGWLIVQNEARWSGVLPRRMRRDPALIEQEEHEQHERVEALEAAIKAYRAEGRHALVEPFRAFFDHRTGELLPSSHGRFGPGSIFAVLAASDNLVVFCEAVLGFAKKVDGLSSRRTIKKLWWPTGLRKIGKLVKGGKADKAVADGANPDKVEEVGAAEDEDSDGEQTVVGSEAGGEKAGKKEKKGKKDKKEKKAKEEEKSDDDAGLDPDARPPKNAFQRFTLALYRFGHFLITPEGLFALKYATGSILIWLFQVFPTTSWLSYTEKSLWALIMFQTGLGVYAGDQLLGSIQKLLGCGIGLVYGMLIWYLGAANGPGSPYGLGAAAFVLMLPALAIRIYAPPASSQVGIQAAVTAILVVGYSWQNSYTASYGNPGIGYNLAWKRALLVIIGTAAAAVFMLLPPQSTRLLVRRTHATCIHELGKLYGTIVSAWIQEDAGSSSSTAEPEADGGAFSASKRKAARARMLALRLKLNSTQPAIIQSTYEISLRGDWPKKEYQQLLTMQLGLLQALAQLGQALTRLDREWRTRLSRETAFLNRPLIADVSSTFALLSLALRQGAPLPAATPGPLLDRLLYHDHRLRLLSSDKSSVNTSTSSAAASTADSKDAAPSASAPSGEIEGARVGSFALTFDVLRDERFGIYASALQALASILLDTDELEGVVKGLVGQVGKSAWEAMRREEEQAW